MKKFLLPVLIIVLFSSYIKAQDENSSSEFVWGVRLGMNWATIKSNFDEGLDSRTSGVIGVFTRHKLNGSFLVQPEVNYILKGATSKLPPELGVIRDYLYSFDYFEIPVLLKYNFGAPIDDRFKPELFAGPFIAFKLSSSLEAREIPNSDVTIDNVKPTDYGTAFGAGIGFKIDNVDILLELRYTLSLSSFDNNVEPKDLRNGKFGVFSLTTGFVIN